MHLLIDNCLHKFVFKGKKNLSFVDSFKNNIIMCTRIVIMDQNLSSVNEIIDTCSK